METQNWHVSVDNEFLHVSPAERDYSEQAIHALLEKHVIVSQASITLQAKLRVLQAYSKLRSKSKDSLQAYSELRCEQALLRSHLLHCKRASIFEFSRTLAPKYARNEACNETLRALLTKLRAHSQ